VGIQHDEFLLKKEEGKNFREELFTPLSSSPA
jgi:hypothetical protein